MSTESRQTRIHASPQWRDGKFRNRLDRIDGKWTRMMREFFFGGSPHRKPTSPVPVDRRAASDYSTAPASGLRVTWLGHSSTLLEIDGRRLLVDPMYAERAGPLSFAGPRRFYEPPIAIADL